MDKLEDHLIPELVDMVDEYIKCIGFKSRDELVRRAMSDMWNEVS